MTFGYFSYEGYIEVRIEDVIRNIEESLGYQSEWFELESLDSINVWNINSTSELDTVDP